MIILCCLGFDLSSQVPSMVFPVVKGYGGIYHIDAATVKPDPERSYKIVVDLYSGGDTGSLNKALNNVARMINLHAVDGVSADSILVVLAIHGGATSLVLKNKAYQNEFKLKNPNLDLIDQLSDAGVKLTVCGQSLIGRKISPSQVYDEIEIATSMLTTVTTYQQKGYTLLKF